MKAPGGDWDEWLKALEGPKRSQWYGRAGVALATVLMVLVVFFAGRASAAPTEAWARIADCESGNWDRHAVPVPHSARWADRRDGYEGGLHFTGSTWRAYRAADMPLNGADGSVFQQVWVAEKVLAAQGWRAWSTCSRKVGLR